MLGTAGKHSDFIFIISNNSPFRDDPAECFFLGLSRLGKGCALSHAFQGTSLLENLQTTCLFSLTIWAMPHHTNFFPFLQFITYIMFFPVLIPPSLFPGTLFHHSKLLVLSHSFRQMRSPRNSAALTHPSGTGRKHDAILYKHLDTTTLCFNFN